MNCRRAKPPFSRNKTRAVATIVIALVIRCGAEVEESAALDPSIRTEIAGYTRLAKEAADQEKWLLADHFLELLVRLPARDIEKKNALREIGETYEHHHQETKAIAIYEKMIELLGSDPETPELLFKVGLLYPQIGVYGRAVSRFYTVLNSALKVNERSVSAYRELTQKAQLEIAETYFLAGDYAQAGKFLNLLLRLDLPPEQRAQVRFRALHCQFLLEDSQGAITGARKFLEEFPDDSAAPECRYLLAAALRTVGRKTEAFDTVLALLREEKARKEKAPERWTYWQKKTGNEFANDFYQQGDFVSALTIYQTLAQLSDEPDWQWPAVYQIGLCFERLRLASRAAEAYKFIIDEAGKPEKSVPPLAENTASLVQMARWRGEQLAWRHTTDARLQHILGEPVDAPTAKKQNP